MQRICTMITSRQAMHSELSFKAVVCWVGSQFSPDPAVQIARSLAALGGGTCSVVMGLDSPRDQRTGHTPLTPEVISRAARKLADLYGPDAHTTVLPGHPVREVRRYAQNHDVDLVVLGSQALSVQNNYHEELSPPCTVMILLQPDPDPANTKSQKER